MTQHIFFLFLQVVKTKAYGKLRHLKYVLHTVGPIFEDLKPDQNVFELAQTFYNCLEMAEKLGLQSVTFPFISTGDCYFSFHQHR